ncbi:MAG: hypothetical protein AAGA02_00015 [Bacteroidota bacterium]
MILTTLRFVWKYYWIVQLLVIITLSYLLKREMSKADDYQEVYELSRKEIQIWRDEAGKNRARADIAEIDAANTKLVLESNLKETIRKEVGNLRKNLISYSSIQASTAGSISGGTVDTVYVLENKPVLPAKTISIRESDLNFKGIFIPSLDTLMAEYQVRHNFDIYYYYRRPGKKPFNFLRRKQAVAEIKFDNPGSQADSLFTIVLKRKNSFLGRLF